MADDSPLPRKLVPAGSYDWPTGPAKETLLHLFAGVLDRFSSDDGNAALGTETLERLDAPLLQDSHLERLRAVYFGLLDETYADWLERDNAQVLRCACAQMPSVPTDILKCWAKGRGLETRSVRACLDEPDAFLRETAPLVIPSLAGAFQRHTDGIDGIDAFAELSVQSQRKLILGCGSWAWTFLDHATDLSLVFTDVRVFPAFDTEAMAELFADAFSHLDAGQIRSARSGNGIFERKSDGSLGDPFFETLCQRSLGCPWIAASMIDGSHRAPRRREAEEGDDEAAAGDVWIAFNESDRLPRGHVSAARQILQAVMIHDGIEGDALAAVLPDAPPTGLVARLVDLGYLRRREGLLSVLPGTYPEVRRHLNAGGLPLDRN